MKFLDTVAAAIPAGKALFWIVAGGVTMFSAGFGVAFGFGETAANIKLVPEIVATQIAFDTRMNAFQIRLDDADAAREQILCLVRLTAEGEPLSPLDVNRLCP